MGPYAVGLQGHSIGFNFIGCVGPTMSNFLLDSDSEDFINAQRVHSKITSFTVTQTTSGCYMPKSPDQ